MSTARHARLPHVQDMTLEEIAKKYVRKFSDITADWEAFEDAKIDGFRRAQHRFIGGGGSGKHNDPDVIPAEAFTCSIMFVNPGEGNAPHTHEVEEIFFVLEGHLNVFFEEEGTGRRIYQKLGKWECVACPAGIIHGYVNDSLEPCYFQVMLGKGRPQTMGYADERLYETRDAHLKTPG
ncbi:cupin domain-containing protein [Ruegeria atlantica]|uniref:cupin domain-containing protein n=1 Tax=Ruegeria atlantica TaxID=81569 RepID=UPI00147BB24E|nr:cupin domain-containing protein [Ruegeria atlantica]